MCNSFVFLFCLIFAAGSASNSSTFPLRPQFRSDYTYYESANGWLKLHRAPAYWHDAHARCHQEGAELVSPTNVGLWDAMRIVIARNHFPCAVFTGIHDTFTPGDFFSLDGVPLNKIPANWNTSTFDCNSQYQDCVIMLPNGLIQFARRIDTHPFICYKKYQNTTQPNECISADNSYKFVQRTGSCYKFHRDAKTWPEAQKMCASEDAQLAVINSAVEAEVLKGIFNEHQPISIRAQFKDSALIGFRDWGEKEGWLTINGQKLSDAGYSIWSPNQPDHSRHPDGRSIEKVPFCGAIYRTAKLDDVWCDVPFVFICEKTPIILANEEEMYKYGDYHPQN